MQRGLRKAKTQEQVRAERRTAAKEVAVTSARIIGIGLVAGTALVVGTNRIMKKFFGGNEKAGAKNAEETVLKAGEEPAEDAGAEEFEDAEGTEEAEEAEDAL